MFAQSLKKGDTVAIVAPAGSFTSEMQENAISALLSIGYVSKMFAKPDVNYGYFSNTDELRANEINQAFGNKEIKAIFCIRGGYGSARIIDMIDFEIINNSEIYFFGYSDITFLLNAIYQKAGKITFHSPMPAFGFSEYSKYHLQKLISENEIFINFSNTNTIKEIKGGIISGILVGGNLSILSSMCGTKWQVSGKNKVVFIEEIGEEPYRIDRMLTQLIQNGLFAQAKGILLGNFKNCSAENPEKSFDLEYIFKNLLGNLGIPVYCNFPFGHIPNSITLPVGGKAEFNFETKILKLSIN